jgi:hypothetical protein
VAGKWRARRIIKTSWHDGVGQALELAEGGGAGGDPALGDGAALKVRLGVCLEGVCPGNLLCHSCDCHDRSSEGDLCGPMDMACVSGGAARRQMIIDYVGESQSLLRFLS